MISFSAFLYIINSILGSVYVGKFLKNKYDKRITIIVWCLLHFITQFVLFEVVQEIYVFNDLTQISINIFLLLIIQKIFYHKDTTRHVFVCFSFMAGKELVKYIASVLNNVIGISLGNVVYKLVMEGKIATETDVEVATNIMFLIAMVISCCAYALVLWVYLMLIDKNYVRKEYVLQTHESGFLILPSITAICISITMKMLVVSVEDGITTIVYNVVPYTMFWIPIICVLLLGAIIANVKLFQNVVQYHDENVKNSLLENQIIQMQKEVEEIQDIYSDMHGLKHDLRGHISNIMHYVKKFDDKENKELHNYINNMVETVERLDFGYQSGNPITDIIIHQKKQEAQKVGVRFDVDFNYPKKLQINAYDIGIILNNALENAIEACSLLKENKYVSLYSYMKGNMFFVEVENTFQKEIKINKENGLPETSKENKKLHGVGIQNIRRCAKKYNGDIDIAIDASESNQKVFNLTIMLNGKTVRV